MGHPFITTPAAQVRAIAKPSLAQPHAHGGLALRTCSIVAVASYLPERVLTSAEVGQGFGEDGEWILSRTGIRERRIAAENQFTSDLAARAALSALQKANLQATDLDLILVATNTPDMPSTLSSGGWAPRPIKPSRTWKNSETRPPPPSPSRSPKRWKPGA